MLKSIIDLSTELKYKTENNSQQKFCKRMNKSLCGKFVEHVRQNKNGSRKTAEQSIKRQPNKDYDDYKQDETEK